MHVVWKFGRLAITAEEIDFRDPAGTGPDVRERGLRIEFRVVDDHHDLAPPPSPDDAGHHRPPHGRAARRAGSR